MEINPISVIYKRILILTQSDGAGGAARAALRLLTCFLSTGIDVTMLVASKSNNKEEILQISRPLKVRSSIYSRIDNQLCRYLLPKSKEWKTSGLFGVVSARALNKSDFDVVNIHWIGHGLISLNQLTKVRKKVIWTLHDEWAIGGITHYQEKLEATSPPFRRTILKILISHTDRKRLKLFENPNLELVPVSSEIKRKLLEKYPQIEPRIHIIPNALDISIFCPTETLDVELPTVLFLGGERDPRKGWDLLRESCFHAKVQYKLLLTGSALNERIGNVQVIGIPSLASMELLQRTYAEASLVVVPSRAEALPQVATEAISCGTPVVAFSIGGLPDIVIENITGKLVAPFDTQELAQAIDKVLVHGKSFYTDKCRQFAIENFSFKKVSSRYQALF